MRHYADIAVYGRDGLLKLLVEVKSKRQSSRDWAARLRRNMYAHGQMPAVPFFLVVLPERFYLWTRTEHPLEEVQPDYEADASSMFQPYVEQIGEPIHALDEGNLELVVTNWLDQLISSVSPSTLPPQAEWLRASGLLDAIRGGRVEVQTLV